MAFDRSKIADEVAITATFPHLYKDEQGNPIPFSFRLRMETEADAEALDRADAASKRTVHQRNLDRLSRLMTAPPAGFDDFPQNGKPLRDEVIEYFGDEKNAHIVRGVLALYHKVVTPEELFRIL